MQGPNRHPANLAGSLSDQRPPAEKESKLVRAQEARLHMVDPENLVFGYYFSESRTAKPSTYCMEQFSTTTDAYFRNFVHSGDSALVGCHPKYAVSLAFYAARGQLRCKKGRDGGERAILEVVDLASMSRRFAQIVIGSGDGYFTDITNELRAAGSQVTVISWSWSLSSRLASAASNIILLDQTMPNPLAA